MVLEVEPVVRAPLHHKEVTWEVRVALEVELVFREPLHQKQVTWEVRVEPVVRELGHL